MTDLLIIIGKTVDDKFYFRIRIEGGRVLLTSREYNQLEKCINEIYGIQQYTEFALVEEFVKGTGYQYTLIGSWGRMVASSPFYTYSYEMQVDMTILKKCIGNATVIDKSSTIRFFRPVRIK